MELRFKVTQSKGVDLRHDNTNATLSGWPFRVSNSLYFLFSDCSLTANGLKFPIANSNFAHKSFIGIEFSKSKVAKANMSGYSFENNPTAKEAAGFKFQPELVRKFWDFWFYGPTGNRFFLHVASWLHVLRYVIHFRWPNLCFKNKYKVYKVLV